MRQTIQGVFVRPQSNPAIELLESRRLLTVLTYDPVSADSVILPSRYGDRVTSASQGGFNYGTTGGATPSVTANFGPLAKNVRQWKTGYGDLTNVIFAGDSASGILEVALRADFGFEVSLASLDLGGGGNHDYTINSITVFDGGNNAIYTRTSAKVDGDFSGSLHTHLSLGNIHSRVLRLRIDASNLGANGDQVGLDNLQFS